MASSDLPNLLLVLSGDAQTLKSAFAATGALGAIELIPLPEKEAVEYHRIVPLIRAKRYGTIALGCKQLGLQRFQLFLKFYLLLGNADRTMLMDQSGATTAATWGAFLFAEAPKFFVELIASVFVVLRAYTVLTFARDRRTERL